MLHLDANVRVVVIDFRGTKIAPIDLMVRAGEDDAVNVDVLALLLRFEAAILAFQLIAQGFEQGERHVDPRIIVDLINDFLDDLAIQHNQLCIIVRERQIEMLRTGIAVDIGVFSWIETPCCLAHPGPAHRFLEPD